MDYRREIDGLRALAVVPVIFFHAGFDFFSGGFVGVDVFFVISGYLITTIILSELEQGKFSIVSFYERRARRILPALYVVMLVCIPFAWFLLLPSDMEDFAKSLSAVSLFLSNHLFLSESGYFDTVADLKPLLHTWSLAVEEQYYVLFPIFLMVTWRLGKRWIVILLAVVGVASLARAEWASFAKPSAAFYLLSSRGWELLIGAFSAFYLSKSNRTEFGRGVCEAGGWLGFALILYAMLAYSKVTPFPGLYALVPTFGTALIILFATKKTSVGRFIGNKAFVSIGLISYSAYLWHQPLFAFARQRSLTEPSKIDFLILVLVSLALAYISWRHVESFFRSKVFVSRAGVFYFSAIGLVFYLCIGLVGYFNGDRFELYWLSRVSESHREFYAKVIYQGSVRGDSKAVGAAHRPGECRFNVRELKPDIEDKFKKCHQKHGPGVLILGDSHAIDLFRVVSLRFEDEFLVGVTSGGCRPHAPRTECQYDGVASFVKENKGVFEHVIYEQAGFYLLRDSNKKDGSRQMFSSLSYAQPVRGLSVDERNVEATLDYLAGLSYFVPVTWFLPRIEPHINRNMVLKSGCEFDWRLRPGLKDVFAELEKIIVEYEKKTGAERLKVVSQNEVFKFNFPDDFLNCRDVYWSDGDHFSDSGERLFSQRLPSEFLKF